MAVPNSPSKMMNDASDFSTGPRSTEGGFLEFFLTSTDNRKWIWNNEPAWN